MLFVLRLAGKYVDTTNAVFDGDIVFGCVTEAIEGIVSGDVGEADVSE